MPDLTSADGVYDYLLYAGRFTPALVVPLAGGNANFTYRLSMKYREGEDDRTMVLKHAESYVANMKDFPLVLDTKRQDYESMALKYARGLDLPSDTIVSVPRLYYEDKPNRILIMSDCGENSKTLKALFQTDPPPIDVSQTIGHSLGTFLAHLHKSPQEIRDSFAGNRQTREIAALISYGWICSTLSPQGEEPILIEPPLDLPREDLETLKTHADDMTARMTSGGEVLAMGDFWPGNILVSSTSEVTFRLTVVDWEVVGPGLAGIDLGQFLAEMHTLRTFHPTSKTSVGAVISSFIDAYRDATLQHNPSTDLVDMAWVAASRLGTHLISCTPRVPWGSKEQTREVVLEGVEYLQRVSVKDEAWLKTSIVGGLLR